MDNKTISFLPHQYEFIQDNTHKILALVGGYGSGKSYTLARRCITLCIKNPGFDAAVLEPTHNMLNEILFPELNKALDEFGIKYVYKTGESIYYCEIYDPGIESFVTTRIICKSLVNYEKLVGLNLAHAHVDEIDVVNADIGYKAYLKLLGRLRVGYHRSLNLYSTPEGFKTLYKIFVDEADETKRLIKAKSTDNPFLPDDFIETMRKQYSDELVESYINGEFTNLTSGSVYKNFDRSLNNTFMTLTDNIKDIHIGIDFNVENMSGVAAITGDNKIYIVDEFAGYEDTHALCQAITDKYLNTMNRGRVIHVYPDASGKNRSTVDASTSNHKILRSYGFKVRVNNTNPSIMDRVITVNSALKNGEGDRHLFINNNNCPELVKGLEQQAYDENTKMPSKKGNVDHQLDAAGYMVVFLAPLRANKKIHIRGTVQHNPHRNE